VLRSAISGRAEIVEDTHNTEYGMREFIVRDPNRFWSRSASPFTQACEFNP
jgi:hypothetical protein